MPRTNPLVLGNLRRVAFVLALFLFPVAGLASESPPTVSELPEVAVAIVDTTGTGYLIVRPLVEYQWLAPTAVGGLPKVNRVRSPFVVFEQEITSELKAFRWEELSRVLPTMTSDGASRVLVTASDGQDYRCLVGYTQASQIPSLILGGGDVAPSQVTRTIKAQRLSAARRVAIEIPWSSISSMEVFSLQGLDATSLARLDVLVQERARLYKRIHTINNELQRIAGESPVP